MKKLIEAIPGHNKEIYGVEVDAIITAFLLVILIAIVREIVGVILPKIFSKISLGSQVAKDALSGSGKALGVAVGCWGGMFLSDHIDWISSVLQLIMVLAIVVTAFRFVGVIHAFVLWTDDDGELDGSQKTVVSAAESIMRFLICLLYTSDAADE